MRKIKAGGKWKKRDDKENKNEDLFRQRLIQNPLAKEEKHYPSAQVCRVLLIHNESSVAFYSTVWLILFSVLKLLSYFQYISGNSANPGTRSAPEVVRILCSVQGGDWNRCQTA